MGEKNGSERAGLAGFIHDHRDDIVDEWTAFARTRLPAAREMDERELRDSAAELVDAIVRDMETPETDAARGRKARGGGEPETMGTVGASHAMERFESGFTLLQLVSEFRALRASVVRRWEESGTGPSARDEVREVIRLDEAIDQTLQESIERYNKKFEEARELFLGMLGHDLRNPIGSIHMSASQMLRDPHLEEHHRRNAARIGRSAERMNRMVGDLLDLTRSQLGSGIPVAPTELDLGAVARQAANEVQAYHADREVRFEADGDLRGRFDGDRLAQVVSNLAGNALEHGDPQAPVIIRLQEAPDGVLLSVHNEGPPIPPHAQRRLFEPMARSRADGSRPLSSLGLGLFIVREIVKAHGGEVSVESTAEKGTTFLVRLPRPPEGAAVRFPPASPAPAPG